MAEELERGGVKKKISEVRKHVVPKVRLYWTLYWMSPTRHWDLLLPEKKSGKWTTQSQDQWEYWRIKQRVDPEETLFTGCRFSWGGCAGSYCRSFLLRFRKWRSPCVCLHRTKWNAQQKRFVAIEAPHPSEHHRLEVNLVKAYLIEAFHHVLPICTGEAITAQWQKEAVERMKSKRIATISNWNSGKTEMMLELWKLVIAMATFRAGWDTS